MSEKTVVLRDCAKCGCFEANHITGASELSNKCMSCGSCNGFEERSDAPASAPRSEGREAREWPGLSADGTYCQGEVKDFEAVAASRLAAAEQRANLAEKKVLEFEEREASVCPEDVGCDEYIPVLHKRIIAANQRAEAVESLLAEARQAISTMTFINCEHCWGDVKDAPCRCDQNESIRASLLSRLKGERA